jgi:transcriptional regulator with XRE-family HTH domain
MPPNRRDLTSDIGRLLREERERKALTQQEFARRTGRSQQWLSRVERGATAPTTAAVQELFALLGGQLRVQVVPLEADLDAQIDELIHVTEEDRLWSIERHDLVRDRLADVPRVLTGRLAAFLPGAPVPAEALEIAIAEADIDALAAVLSRLTCIRWSERWREFRGYDTDPRHPGALSWLVGSNELRVEVAPTLPRSVTIRIGDHHLSVRPLAELKACDAELAAVMRRVRDRLARAGGPEPG